MNTRSHLRTAALVGAGLIPALAQAHPGHAAGDSFIAGALHPVLGADHLAALLAVGLLAGRMGGAARWAIPATFLTLMGGGACAALAGIGLPFTEVAILASCGVLALLACFPPRRLPLATATLAGGFAVFHGHAHGAEAAHGLAALQYLAGLLLASAAVIGTALSGAVLASRRRAAPLFQLHHRH